MATAVLSILTLVLGAFLGSFLGYYFRRREFSREQQLRVYGAFVGSFLAAVDAGTVLTSIALQLGDEGMRKMQTDPRIESAWSAWSTTSLAFNAAASELRMIASAEVRTAAEELETYLEKNIRAVPPFVLGTSTEEWGEEAKLGPRIVGERATPLAHAMADTARVDVG